MVSKDKKRVVISLPKRTIGTLEQIVTNYRVKMGVNVTKSEAIELLIKEKAKGDLA